MLYFFTSYFLCSNLLICSFLSKTKDAVTASYKSVLRLSVSLFISYFLNILFFIRFPYLVHLIKNKRGSLLDIILHEEPILK